MKNNIKYRLTPKAQTCIVAIQTCSGDTKSKEEELALLRAMIQRSDGKHPGDSVATGMRHLTAEEEVALLHALARTSPDGSFTEAEGQKIFEWARNIRVQSALLEGALRGWINIAIRHDGQLVFGAVDPKEILAALGRRDVPPSVPGSGG